MPCAHPSPSPRQARIIAQERQHLAVGGHLGVGMMLLAGAFVPLAISAVVIWLRVAVARAIARRMWQRVRGARLMLKMMASQRKRNVLV